MAKPHHELIAREGMIFLIPLVILTAVALFLGWPWWIALVFGLLAVYVAAFFRNPYRQIPDDPRAIVSPADGKVVVVEPQEDGGTRISVFLNIFNVHINRTPIGGTVESVTYTPGKFLNAMKPEASLENERNTLVIDDNGFRVTLVQIAGLIARRVVCWTAEGESLSKGQRIGLMRFGSRMDIHLPPGCDLAVTQGQKIRGGSGILARRPAAHNNEA